MRGEYREALSALEESSLIVGEDPGRNIDLLMQAFAGGEMEAIVEPLAQLAREEGPNQELMKRASRVLKMVNGELIS